VQHPDYLARLQKTFGDKIISAEESAAIRDANRGERLNPAFHSLTPGYMEMT
jgi:hypothetical protein